MAKGWKKQARAGRNERRGAAAGSGQRAQGRGLTGSAGGGAGQFAQAEDSQPRRGRAAQRREEAREELAEQLRALARWKNNDVVKLAFLEGESLDRVDGLDLSGVVELRRNANGTFEAKFVDRVRVLAMLRELLEQREDGRLEEFMDALKQPGEDGGA